MEPKELLKKLGFDLKEVEEAKEPDELIEKFHEKSKAENFEIFKNDLGAKDLTPENIKGFLKESKNKTFGELAANLDRQITKLVPEITAEQLKDMKLPEKMESLSEALKEKYSAGQNKDITELQKKNVELQNEAVKAKEEAEEKIRQAFKEADTKLINDKVSWGMKSKFLNVPKDKLLTGKHNDAYFLASNSFINTKYDFTVDEHGEIIPLVKGSQQRVTDKKDGKEYFVTADDLLLKTLDELGFIQKSNGNGQTNVQQRTQTIDTGAAPKNNGTDHSAVFDRGAKIREQTGYVNNQ